MGDSTQIRVLYGLVKGEKHKNKNTFQVVRILILNSPRICLGSNVDGIPRSTEVTSCGAVNKISDILSMFSDWILDALSGPSLVYGAIRKSKS
mmetsp:Transcript_24034/g.66608  ORF Transcript_24034/g.66608 Transcript_24034/m.66608 type:complete len:93 (+) Transcript_24034:4846-5124(+)